MRKPKYVITKLSSNMFIWDLVAPNGCLISCGGEVYTRARDALRSINRAEKYAKQATDVVYEPGSSDSVGKRLDRPALW